MTISPSQPSNGDRRPGPTPGPLPAADETNIRHLKLADSIAVDIGSGLRAVGTALQPVDIDTTVGVATLTAAPEGDGQTGQLRVARAELARLRTEMAGLLDRVRRLEQGAEETVLTVPTAGPSSPAVPPMRPWAITPRPAPAVGGPAPSGPDRYRAGSSGPRPRRDPPPRLGTCPLPAAPTHRLQGTARRTTGRTGPPACARAPAVIPGTPARPAPPRSMPAARPVPVERPASLQPAKAPRAAPTAPAAASDGLEAEYSALLAEVLGIAEVSATSNFFDDLGADSLLMARFCARVRSRPDLPNVAIKDIYRAPTIAALAAAGADSLL